MFHLHCLDLIISFIEFCGIHPECEECCAEGSLCLFLCLEISWNQHSVGNQSKYANVVHTASTAAPDAAVLACFYFHVRPGSLRSAHKASQSLQPAQRGTLIRSPLLWLFVPRTHLLSFSTVAERRLAVPPVLNLISVVAVGEGVPAHLSLTRYLQTWRRLHLLA